MRPVKSVRDKMNLTLLVLCFLLGGIELSQGGQCRYSLSAGSASYAASGGSGSFDVSVNSGCSWAATTASGWIHTTNSGSGTGTIYYTVDANADVSSRSGTILVVGADQTFLVSQSGAPLTLGIALDNTNLIWVTGSDYPWTGTTAPTFDGVAAAVSGNRFVPNSASWVQTTVVGPGTLSFWWKVDCLAAPDLDHLEFDIGGVAQDQIAGTVDWNYRTYAIPAGTNTLTWQYIKDEMDNSGLDRGWLDRVTYTTNAPIGLAEAVNTCGVDWSSGGNSNPTYWEGESSVTHDGQAAAQSGALYSGQESWMQASVIGATNISFWWKVSSQTNNDYLEFCVNGVLATRISGEAGWQSNSFSLATPTNVVQWRFARAGNSSPQGQNRGWVDQVTFEPVAPTLSRPTLTGGQVLTSGAFQLSFSGPEGQSYKVLASTNLSLPAASWTVLTSGTFGASAASFSDSPATNYSCRFYRLVSP